MGVLDFIFPKYCVNCKKYGEFLCINCFSYLSFDVKNICAVCSYFSFDGSTHIKCKSRYSIDGISSAVGLNKVSRKLVNSFKNRPYVSSLATFMSELIYESIIQKEELKKILEQDFVFVPIPLSSKMLRKRGFNQSQLLGKNLSKKLSKNILNVLVRENEGNAKDIFTIKNKYKEVVKGSYIVLVDDTFITGSTFNKASYELKKNGAYFVWGIAFAKQN